MHKSMIAAASMLLTLPGAVQAAEPPCLTQTEFSALAAYALPSVIDGANERCGPWLDSKAFLATDGDKLVAQYESRKGESWPVAKAAFLKMSAKTDDKANNLLKLLPDDLQQEMVDQILQALVVQEIPTQQCGTIDDFARLLSPLPPANTARLLALIVSLAGKPGKDGGKSALGKLTICQEPK